MARPRTKHKEEKIGRDLIEKKVPQSFSAENSLMEKFNINCRNQNTTASVKIREFILEFNKPFEVPKEAKNGKQK